jgi:biotin operon repressor
MPYESYQRIGERFKRAVALIQYGSYNARQLADDLKVSRPTVHRMVVELRRRGNNIRAVRDGNGWHYELEGKHHLTVHSTSNKRRTPIHNRPS